MSVVWHHEQHAHERKTFPKRGPIVRWILGACVILGVVVSAGWFAFGGWRSGHIPVAIERVAWVPIGRASGGLLWYRHVARTARGIAAADGRDNVTEADFVQAVDACARRIALEALADELSVSISRDAVTESVEWTDDVRAFLTLATWNEQEYLEYVQRSFVLSHATEEATRASSEYHDATARAMDVILERLAAGIAFADVAYEYSEDPGTAQVRGSFGYVLPGEIDPVFDPVFALPIGEMSDVIIADDAFWIVQVEDRIVDGSGERTLLRGIAVKKKTLADILDDQVAQSPSSLWVR